MTGPGAPTSGGVRAAAAALAADWSTRAERHDRDGSFSHENIERAWAAGLGNLSLDADLRIEIRETWDHLGMRATASHDVLLRDVQVPDEHAFAFASVGRPEPPPAELAAWLTLLVAAVYLGVADAARDWLVRYLNERTPANLGAPLATLPRFQAAVGEIEARLFAASAAFESVAVAADSGTADASAAALAKVVGTRAAIESVQDAVALIGNPGLTRANPLERHLRDVLCSRIHTPQDDSVLGGAGRGALADVI